MDMVSNKRVRIWKTGVGLTTPEHAEPDKNARYLIDVPLPPLSRSSLEKMMLSAPVKRAAAWYDSTVPLQNERFADRDLPTRYSLSNDPPDLPAFYDLRIPMHYKADGSWGLVIFHGFPSADEFFPKRLRDICDEHKLLFATIKPPVRVGEWHQFTLMVSLIGKIDIDFNTDSKRSVAVGETTYERPIALLGSLLPERVSHTITGSPILVPYNTGNRFRAHPRLFGSLRTDQVFELLWLSKNDWSSPDLSRTNWAYGRYGLSLEAINTDILPLWKDVGKEYKLIDISNTGIFDSLHYMLSAVMGND